MAVRLGRRSAYARRVTQGPAQQLADADDQELFRRLVESVQDYAIFMLSPSGHVATWNPGAQRIKGYDANEIIGQHFSRFYSEDEVLAGKCEIELRVAARQGRFEDEGWRVRKDGTLFWANVVISAVRDNDGNLLGFTKVTRDLTERKKAEEERAARIAAEEANRAKDAFLAMLGHELRNPLAPIFTALQLIKLRGGGGEDPAFQVIERQSKHMARLVDDLLDVSRINRGKIELSRAPIDLRKAIEEAIEVAGDAFKRRGHEFTVGLPAEAISVFGDETRLTQVFTNLLTNAAKYTRPHGRVTLTAKASDREVVVEVADTGIGIEAGLLPNVFDLFVQGRQGLDRADGGLGLGLTLVKALVVLHGGTVSAQSPGPGLGSTFTVRLPIAQSKSVSVTLSPTGFELAQTPRRVLVVDDNDDARFLLREGLRLAGHEVRTAENAPAALELIRSFTPEIAILDIGLPGIDGYALALALRARLASQRPRLIALTGYGQPKDRLRSAEVGFEHHLLKPVDLPFLLRIIESAEAEPESAGDSTSRGRSE